MDQSKVILLVEDDYLLASLETRQLTNEGYQVIHAASGQEAILAASKQGTAIDLILMDINLGCGIDGTEAAEKILKHRDLPLLFLSSHTEKEVVEKTEKITNYGYVVKNSSFTVLDASIKMAFKLYEAQKRIREINADFEASNEELEASLQSLQETNAKLALSEEKFSKAFRLNPDSININRLSDGVYVEINQGFTQMSGYTEKDVIGRSSLPGDLGIWAHREERERLIDGLRETGVVPCLEAEFRRKDGTVILGRMSAQIVEINGTQCVLSITKDITNNKKTEEAIMRTQGILKSALDGQRDFYILSVDKDFNCLYRNRAYQEIKARELGFAIEVGQNLLDRLSGNALFRNAFPHYKLAFQGVSTRVTEERVDANFYIDAFYNPVYAEDGEIIGATSFSVDVSERKKRQDELGEAQSKYRALLDSMGEGFCCVDKNEIFRLANPSSEKIFGVGRDGLLGKSYFDFTDEEGRSQVEEENRARAKGRSSEYVTAIIRADGERRWIRVIAAPLNPANGRYEGSSALFRDITDEVKATETLNGLVAKKEVLMKELQHRVKNSLSIVSGLLDIAAFEISEPKAEAILADTKLRIRAMSAIYERLYLSENVDAIDFGAYVEELAKSIFGTIAADRDRIRLETRFGRVIIDTKSATSLGLIVNELLTNAIKHAFPGDRAGTIVLTLESDGANARLTVADDGVGIDPRVSERPTTMGMTLIRLLAEKELQASVLVDTSAGTAITIAFRV